MWRVLHGRGPPAATLDPFGVARDHGSEISSDPALYSAALAALTAKPTAALKKKTIGRISNLLTEME